MSIIMIYNYYILFTLLINAEGVKICNKRVTDKYIKDAYLTMGSSPITLTGGARVTISLGLEIIKEIPVGATMMLELIASNGDRLPCIGADFWAQRCHEKMFCVGNEWNRYGPSVMAPPNLSKIADIKQVMRCKGNIFNEFGDVLFCLIFVFF